MRGFGSSSSSPAKKPQTRHTQEPRAQTTLEDLSWHCPHPTPCLEMQTGLKAQVLTLRELLCSFQSCFICCKMGASITCCETSCPRTFHLPCAPDGECVTQYFGTYR